MQMGAHAEVASGSRRRNGALAIATAAIVVTGAVVVIVVSSRGGNATRVGTPDAGAAPAAPTQMETAVGWVDGLVAGRILPSDITSRLGSQDPAMANVVWAAWRELGTSGSQARMHEALRWVDGLAAGRILTSDVTSRLGAQDPAMAKIVTATWADLGPFANRSV